MNESGISLKDISDKQFSTVQTDKADSIIKGLEQSGIPYHARYSDSMITIAFSTPDKAKITQIVEKNTTADSEKSEILERFRSNPDNMSNVKALLPEIAEVLNVSVSSLERKPPDLQMQLALTYTAYCFSDDLTVKKALKEELSLNHETLGDIQQLETEKLQPDISHQPTDGSEQLHRQETEEQLKQRSPFISIKVLKQNAKRIREEQNSNGERKRVTENTEEFERERK